jgi:hypothetical protein
MTLLGSYFDLFWVILGHILTYFGSFLTYFGSLLGPFLTGFERLWLIYAIKGSISRLNPIEWGGLKPPEITPKRGQKEVIFGSFLGHFWVIFGSFLGHFWVIFDPFLVTF